MKLTTGLGQQSTKMTRCWDKMCFLQVWLMCFGSVCLLQQKLFLLHSCVWRGAASGWAMTTIPSFFGKAFLTSVLCTIISLSLFSAFYSATTWALQAATQELLKECLAQSFSWSPAVLHFLLNYSIFFDGRDLWRSVVLGRLTSHYWYRFNSFHLLLSAILFLPEASTLWVSFVKGQ